MAAKGVKPATSKTVKQGHGKGCPCAACKKGKGK